MRIAVLASGSGTNLQAIINAAESGAVDGSVRVVISDNEEAYAQERARKHGVEALFVSPREHKNREAYDTAVVSLLQEREIDLVLLAGFMRLLSPLFVRAYRWKIMNIHPSLLPSFPGLEGVKQALEYGVKVSGCTVHFVDEGLDTGPIILQEAVPVYDDDEEKTLHARIHEVEHRLYPRAVQLFREGKLSIEGRRCFIDER